MLDTLSVSDEEMIESVLTKDSIQLMLAEVLNQMKSRENDDVNESAVNLKIEKAVDSRKVTDLFAHMTALAGDLLRENGSAHFKVNHYQCYVAAIALKSAARFAVLQVPSGQGKSFIILLLALQQLKFGGKDEVFIFAMDEIVSYQLRALVDEFVPVD